MARQIKQYTIEQFMRVTKMSGLSFSHDELEILVTSNKHGIPNAYSIPVAGGPPRQLTFTKDEPIKSLSYFPRDRRILYMKDKGGIENRHLCVLEENGKETCLTEGERARSGFYGWSNDGRYFYCTTDERAENHFDVYQVDAGTYERSMMFQNDDGYLFAGVSPDREYLVLIKAEGLSHSNLFLYKVRDQLLRQITPSSGSAYYLPLYFEQASGQLYYRTSTTEEEDEFCIGRFDLKSGVCEVVNRWKGKFRQVVISESRRYMAMVEDAREGARISLREFSTNGEIALPNLPEGNVTSVALSRSDSSMAFYVSGDRQPNELYIYDFLSGHLRRLTNNLNPEIEATDLVDSEAISFKSFDVLEIPGLLWKPHQADVYRKAPALVWVHGGPIGQTRKAYAGAVQYLVNHGYIVLAVNHRGSTGYGKAFMKAADRRQGREPLWDCIEGKRYLSTLGCVDSSRIGIIGGSFGGYMALAALTFQPEEFAVGVAICGVSNLVRHVEGKLGHPRLGKIYVEKIGDPHLDREMLEQVSPIFHAQRIVKPLMVLHGAKDPRADKAESDDIVQAVRANGGTVEYVEFEDEAHGFRKRANSILAYETILRFLDKHLKVSTGSCEDFIRKPKLALPAPNVTFS
jgi:dipeptidyl aminopeptidase/acylaminoacyl peptidase